jgi:hypothetical protein
MITVGFSTRNDNQKYIDYLIKTSGIKNVEVIQKINNGEKSLSQTYNEILNESTNDVVILCHDDLEFDTKDWGKRIIKHFEKSDFGILGVAGTTEIADSGMWWQDKRKMIGIVNHKHEGKKWESKYSKSWGDEINEGCFVDGLFIAVNKKRIKENFDESVKGFHFYDVYFSVKNFLKGVKVGVIYNVRLTHLSIGQTNESWEENRKVFAEEYKKNLPIISKVNLNYLSKDFKYQKKLNLKIIINSSEETEHTEKVLEKIKTFNLPNTKILLISNENNLEEIKKLEDNNIKVFEGFFNELSKNLSVLKWEEDFVTKDDDLIFFIDKNVTLLNNVFSSISKIYHTEKSNFGCAFSSSLNPDLTIFSTDLVLFKNQNNQFGVDIKHNGSIYNILDGYKISNFGCLSDVFATTYSFLKSNDWFDIQYDTNISFNDFAIKCVSKNKKVYVDTDSISTQNSFSNQELVNQDLSKLINVIMVNQKTQNLIQTVNG